MEPQIGIEPMNEGFADPCLTTWLLRRFGAGEGTRTLTPLLATDFKSVASTIPPPRPLYIRLYMFVTYYIETFIVLVGPVGIEPTT